MSQRKRLLSNVQIMKMTTYSWVHPSLEFRNVPGIGIGTFTKDPIPKNDLVIVQGGRILASPELDLPQYEPYGYHCFQVERDQYICPIEPVREIADGVFNVNHSCEPTCGFRGQISMVALRDITAGEQITFDYAMTDVERAEELWEPMPCLCGTASCRGNITGSDWKLPEIREKYAGYFSRYVEDLIRNNAD